jgi:phospholipid transport system substrate-binding protein
MLKRCILFVVTGVFLASNALAGVTDDIKKAVDEVVKVVSDKEMKRNDTKRRQALKKSIGSIFDFNEMAKRSMGKHWNQRSTAEKKQFVELFASLLESSYASKIESYNNEKFVYMKELVDGEYAEVKSKVITVKHDEFTLDYRLFKENGKWMVYDVVIEGVGLVSNYRSQFNKIIISGGYPDLVKKLQSKTNDLKAL